MTCKWIHGSTIRPQLLCWNSCMYNTEATLMIIVCLHIHCFEARSFFIFNTFTIGEFSNTWIKRIQEQGSSGWFWLCRIHTELRDVKYVPIDWSESVRWLCSVGCVTELSPEHRQLFFFAFLYLAWIHYHGCSFTFF